MPNPHINPNPSPKAQALSNGRKFQDHFDPSGPAIDEVNLIDVLPDSQRTLLDVRVQGNKVQKLMVVARLRHTGNGAWTEKFTEWIDA
jgi:hypothetical protein